MKLYIGIDLGTSSVKLLLMDSSGEIKNTVTKDYPLEFPHPGWSQQNPEDWRRAVFSGIPELLNGFDADQLAGIGCGGQMHGLVVIDSSDRVIRPAILWNDGRTSKQVDYLNNVIGKDTLSKWTANIAFAGFTAPKILWMETHEKENFDRIRKIRQAKRMTFSCQICGNAGHACGCQAARDQQQVHAAVHHAQRDQRPHIVPPYRQKGKHLPPRLCGMAIVFVVSAITSVVSHIVSPNSLRKEGQTRQVCPSWLTVSCVGQMQVFAFSHSSI